MSQITTQPNPTNYYSKTYPNLSLERALQIAHTFKEDPYYWSEFELMEETIQSNYFHIIYCSINYHSIINFIYEDGELHITTDDKIFHYLLNDNIS